MKFRKKPVIIEAVLLRWDTWPEMCDFLGPEFFAADGDLLLSQCGKGHSDGDAIGLDIQTMEGTLHASENDWIIRGVKGELYPCKPDIFELTYEPAP